ncbi:hypothetical protein FHS68_002025 [Dyadobacter arcticus]|uniref:DUF4304 domain-containing protein n=1 Tax=Dyadobacter arcticus TaxID=1078754 RepID=A0ABX0UMG9_9BACT|nr:hypothetical protein [Dyadobacter arcticus]
MPKRADLKMDFVTDKLKDVGFTYVKRIGDKRNYSPAVMGYFKVYFYAQRSISPP